MGSGQRSRSDHKRTREGHSVLLEYYPCNWSDNSYSRARTVAMLNTIFKPSFMYCASLLFCGIFSRIALEIAGNHNCTTKQYHKRHFPSSKLVYLPAHLSNPSVQQKTSETRTKEENKTTTSAPAVRPFCLLLKQKIQGYWLHHTHHSTQKAQTQDCSRAVQGI